MTLFGTLSDGRAVHAIALSGHGLTATVLNYGAILQDVRLDGIAHSLTVGSTALSDYEQSMPYHGAIVGPVANRITGARAIVDGIEHMFGPNLDRKHTLHGGHRSIHNRIWDVTQQSNTHVELSVSLMDGENGFPANRTTTALFEVIAGPALQLTITTTTDAPTLVNATNHSYWCLDGSGTMNGHDLQILTDRYLPVDADGFPTGEIADVAGTSFDFQAMTPFRLGAFSLDNTYCLSEQRTPLKDCVILSAKGITMTVATTEAGVHIFDNVPKHAGLAIEAQSWPDAAQHPHFPSILVTQDAPCVQVTQWKFTQN